MKIKLMLWKSEEIICVSQALVLDYGNYKIELVSDALLERNMMQNSNQQSVNQRKGHDLTSKDWDVSADELF